MFDTMVFTKVIGALCGALLIFLVGKWVADELYVAGSRDLEPAFSIALVDEDGEAEVVAELTFDQAMAVADASAGQNLYPQCRACHSLDDGRNGVGPYLHNVMGRDIGAAEGFNYSGALPSGETWAPENLSAFLADPRDWAPGTSMAYAGMRDMQDRANLIAYLITQSPDFDYEPPAVEEAAVEEAPVEEAPVDEAAVEEEAPAEVADESPIRQAFAQADPESGSALWRNCMACHVADSESNRVGPHLYGVYEREIGAVDGFRYSGNLPDGTWTLENISALIENPREFAPGTTMVYPGMRDLQDRADLIAYMISVGPEDVAEAVLSGEVPAEEAPAEEAPVEEEEAAVEPEEADASPIAQAYADADREAGRALWRNCMACHVADSESNRVGPHLVGVLGREIGAVEGFRYSGNLPEGTWTLENFSALIENPREFAPGTTMVYPGMRDLQDRANLIAYIDSVGG